MANKPIPRFRITIGGQKVAYMKRVSYGAPYLVFATGENPGMAYEERVAKGWVTTLSRYFNNVEMTPAN